MLKAKPFISQVNLVATQFDQTLAFYRLLGLDLPEPAADPSGVLHVEADVPSGAHFALDNEHLARLYNAARRAGTDRNSVLVCIEFADRTEIDAAYARLTAAGHEGLQPPHDAFWGSRFAMVRDPEGNSVGLRSKAEDALRSWPPQDSPAG
ncbi:MAG: VOC family protein [Burkholderiales bacterium]